MSFHRNGSWTSTHQQCHWQWCTNTTSGQMWNYWRLWWNPRSRRLIQVWKTFNKNLIVLILKILMDQEYSGLYWAGKYMFRLIMMLITWGLVTFHWKKIHCFPSFISKSHLALCILSFLTALAQHHNNCYYNFQSSWPNVPSLLTWLSLTSSTDGKGSPRKPFLNNFKFLNCIFFLPNNLV